MGGGVFPRGKFTLWSSNHVRVLRLKGGFCEARCPSKWQASHGHDISGHLLHVELDRGHDGDDGHHCRLSRHQHHHVPQWLTYWTRKERDRTSNLDSSREVSTFFLEM